MKRNWRPKEGWVNPYIEHCSEVVKVTGSYTTPKFIEESKALGNSFEAGADALLNKLREKGYPIKAGESFGNEETGARTIVRVNGKVVFIPDEEAKE